MKINFTKEFTKLNPEQKQAVETIYGPVLLTAGPGTGKTRVLTMRIANILRQTDADPQNIIALTFTENATTEMRDRLNTLIGAEAYNVNIHTFHEFANNIIQDYPEKFILAKKLEVIDELAEMQLWQEIISKTKLKYLSTAASPMFFIWEIKSKISDLKREGFNAKRFQKLAEQEAENFTNIPDTEKMNAKTGKMKTKYTKQEKKVQKWLELGKIFQIFEEEMQQRGFYNYDDMILFVLQKLQTDQDLLFELREKYQFFLIDEFQDTNGVQLGLLQTILEDEQPNIFAVGDADQSIYRFQGASMENILLFRHHFQGTKELSLKRNYRSSTEIVHLANKLIQFNQERLTVPKIISEKGESNFTPKLDQLVHQDDEQFFILQQIQKLHQQGIPYSEIAIIFRKNAEGRNWLAFLERNDIPVSFASQTNALQSVRVQQLLTILQLIIQPTNDELFFKVLSYDFSPVPIRELWQIWLDIKTEKINFCQAKNKNKKMDLFLQKLAKWQTDQHNLNLPDFLRKILQESGLLPHLLNEKTLQVESLNHLSSILGEAEKLFYQGEKIGVDEFLANLKLRDEFKLTLNRQELQSNSDTVQLLTTHKAKGLEFEAVFIPNVLHGHWNNNKSPNRLALPESVLEQAQSHEKLEEERRLFFVALTRAKKYLFMSYASQDQNGREKTKSRFAEELELETASTKLDKNLLSKVKAKMQFKILDQSAKNLDLIRKQVAPENFKLSHTFLEDYRLCPRKCLYEHVLRVPRAKPFALVLGTAVHAGLEAFFLDMKQNKKEADIKTALTAFLYTLEREKIDQDTKERIREAGLEILQNYLQAKQGTWQEVLGVEIDFRSHNVVINGNIPLTGKIDKVEIIDKTARRVKIIDYKTAKRKTAKEIRGETKSSQLYHGSYYRQLVFFALLAQKSAKFNYTVDELELQFLKPNEHGQYQAEAFSPSSEEIDNLKKEIAQAWQNIQNLNFAKLPPEERSRVCEKIGEGQGKCPFYEICWQKQSTN